MFENGVILKAESNIFDNGKLELDLLGKQTSKRKGFSKVIYGRNGSGKSTVCKLIDYYRNDKENSFENIKLYDAKGNAFDDEWKRYIYVFNESFIDSQVKFKEEGLDTILMLGKNAEIDQKINELKNKREEIIKNIKCIDLTIFEDEKNQDNPKYIWKKMISKLKESGNWATRRKQIKSLKTSASVNDKVLNEIIINHSKKGNTQEFEEKLQLFLKVQNNNEKCSYQLPIFNLSERLNEIQLHLNKIPEKENNDELSNKLYKIIENYGNQRVAEIKSFMIGSKEVCPYCFQEIDLKHRTEIINHINHILSEKTREFLNIIEQYQVEYVQYDKLPNFIDEQLIQEYKEKLEQYNSELTLLNENIANKLSNIYACVDLRINEIKSAEIRIIEVKNRIESTINDHNVNVDNIAKLEDELHEMNNYISWNSIRQEYSLYKNSIQNENATKQKFKELEEKISNVDATIVEITKEKVDVMQAVKVLNENLTFVFMSRERLRIDFHDNKYIVYSKGNKVKLIDLSTAERNIIALCYFFASIGNYRQDLVSDNNEYLVVLDDPISSLDNENKLGVFGFLRKSFRELLVENSKTRFLLFTHSYEVNYHLSKIMMSLYDELGYGKDSVENNSLMSFKLNNKFKPYSSQYKVLLDNIHKYSIGEDSELTDLTVGNSVRRALEMFTSFEYNKGIDYLQKKVLDINDSNLGLFLNSFMINILVHNESHEEAKSNCYDEMCHNEMFTNSDKRIVSKVGLLIIALLNVEHMRAYLPGETDTILKWQKIFTSH